MKRYSRLTLDMLTVIGICLTGFTIAVMVTL